MIYLPDIFKPSDYRSRTLEDNIFDYRAWIPFAHNVHSQVQMPTRGEYENGYPRGAVIHYTASRISKGKLWPESWPTPSKRDIRQRMDTYAERCALSVMKRAAKEGYNFLIMDVFGRVYQSQPLTKWGYHAGKSSYGKLGNSLSNQLVGVELINPGRLTIQYNHIGGVECYETWYGQRVPKTHVRIVEGEAYCRFTVEQEESLIQLCLWLKENSPDNVFQIDHILGHHEISPGRKTDPGGCLSTPMWMFRSELKKRSKGVII